MIVHTYNGDLISFENRYGRIWLLTWRSIAGKTVNIYCHNTIYNSKALANIY